MSPDIAEPREIVHVDNHSCVQEWHGRMLLEKLEAAHWVAAEPDLETGLVDLAEDRVVATGRNGSILGRLAHQMYFFDVPSAADQGCLRLEGATCSAAGAFVKFIAEEQKAAAFP